MSVIAEAVRHMMKAGMSADAIADAVAAMEAATAPVRSKGAERTARWRHKASQSVTRDTPDKEIPPTPPKENNPTPPSPPKGGSVPPTQSAAALPNQYDELQAKLLKAAGIENFRAERAIGLVNLAPIIGLIQQGYDLESDILPIIAVLFRRPKKPNSWGYCVQPIIEAATAKRGIPPKPKAAEIDWPAVLLAFRNQGIWYEQRYGPRPGEPKCRVPPELLTDAA